ncbi:hypothetical protein AAC03nite_33620 [Alicyclobacillus acidoterrestris]|nr:hypothetical protein AAC03nite_33620 [Alicyclobacillus acidoterrestris]
MYRKNEIIFRTCGVINVPMRKDGESRLFVFIRVYQDAFWNFDLPVAELWCQAAREKWPMRLHYHWVFGFARKVYRPLSTFGHQSEL